MRGQHLEALHEEQEVAHGTEGGDIIPGEVEAKKEPREKGGDEMEKLKGETQRGI